MEQDRTPSRDPEAPMGPEPGAVAAAHDDDPPSYSAMASLHLPAIVDPLAPAEADTAFSRTRRLRHDGWTPERMRDFLERFAECGIVAEACQAAGMSARSAYNLRDRDPLFAAGWDAASVKARPRLADEAFARAMTGVVERIYKDGIVVAERHRHDNRLTMAVLARLDARLDRAAETDALHVGLAAHWDDFLAALAEDRRADLAALVAPYASDDPESDDAESAKQRELRELQQKEEAAVAAEPKEKHKVWREAGRWWTDFPPPPGFDGKAVNRYGDYSYRRHCTSEEAVVMDARQAEEEAAREARRAAWFGLTAGGGAPG